ncbi:MAG: YidC/Oxa1 family membrane protein insertase [Candidatus Pacebacteria bacterium]|nr:YidC/Oxa1 family membrane protein insertase [Candidatus Paceibacterota bacterium]
MDTSPLFDAGMAVLLLTVIIKLILFPLSKKAVITQLRMKQIAPELEKVKEEYKDDKQVQAQKTLELYKENGIRPFASILLIFIQLPIIFALYKVFLQSGLPEINTELLYSFVPTPENVNVMFLGLIDITSKSWILAICAAVTNFFQIRYSMPAYTPKEGAERTLKDDFAKSMQLQMKYVFPVVVLFIAYSISGAIAIYWTTSNLFMIGQELVLRKHKRKHEQGQD